MSCSTNRNDYNFDSCPLPVVFLRTLYSGNPAFRRRCLEQDMFATLNNVKRGKKPDRINFLKKLRIAI